MKKNYMAVAVAAMILTGCSAPELEVDTPPQAGVLGFGPVVTADLVTRAAFNAPFTINLTEDTGHSSYTAVYDRDVTYTTKYEIAGDPIYVSAGRTLTAWAPAAYTNNGASKENEFTLTTGVYDAAKDLIYDKVENITAANCGAVAINFKHAMAKITFKFSFPDGHTPKSISNFFVNGLAETNTYDILSGVLGTPTAAKQINIITTAENIADKDESKAVLAVPVEGAVSGVKIGLTVDGTALTADVTGLTVLAANTNYTVTIKIADKTVGIDSVTDAEWTPGNGGEVEPK